MGIPLRSWATCRAFREQTFATLGALPLMSFNGMYRGGWMGSTSALARIAALVSLPAVTVLLRPNTPAQEKPYRGAYTTGMTTRRFTPKEPYNWRGAQDHALGTVIWYPAVSSATERPVEVTGLT